MLRLLPRAVFYPCSACVVLFLKPEEEGEEGASGLIIPMEEFEGPEAMVFPRELGWLPTQLFHLRRGPLLGPLLQNSDDPLCLRQLFLRGGLEDCVRMMAPNMFSLKVTRACTVCPIIYAVFLFVLASMDRLVVLYASERL